jgi:hypothetical protein
MSQGIGALPVIDLFVYPATTTVRGLHLPLMVVCLSFSTPVQASRLTVPDEASTIQAAVDANVDTVLVRAGIYPEAPIVRRPVFFQAAALECPLI